MHRGKVAWITGDLKFMTGGKKVKEVYNLRDDRFETTDIKAQYSDEVNKMEKYIMDWNLSCKNSHSGGDYKGEFVPVDRWSGIDVEKGTNQNQENKEKNKKNKKK